MEINKSGFIRQNFQQNNILSYLSKVIISKTDEEIEKKKNIYVENKEHLSQLKDSLKLKKETLIKEVVEQKRLSKLYEVLRTVDTLKKEGVLIGNNRVKIMKMLDKLQDQNIQTLKSVGDKLIIYLPDNKIFSS